MDELKADKRIFVLAEEKPVKAVVKMGVPVTMGMLFMVVYNLVDTYFIGLLHDDYQLAAANLAYPVMMVLVALAGIVGNGGASYIARCMGAGKKEEAEHTLTIGFEMIVLGGIFIAILGALGVRPLVLLLGAKEHTIRYTIEYCLPLLVGAVFVMGNYAFGQLLRSEGSSVQAMVGMIAGTVANIILDPLFIFTFKWGIFGASVATVLGNAIGMAVLLVFYMKKKTLLQPSIRYLAFDRGIIKEIMVVGIPHTLEQFFSTAAMIVNNNLAAGYGELSVAAMGIANKIMSFGSYLYQGMAAGCQPLMGYNYGANNISRMRQLIRSGMFVTTAMELAVMVLYGVFAPIFIGLFTKSPEVLAIGTKTLRAFMLMLPFVGTTSIVRNTFNAIGKPMFAFGITVVRQLVLYIPFLLLFNAVWGYTGLIHAQPAEECLCMAFSLILLFRQLKRYETNMVQK